MTVALGGARLCPGQVPKELIEHPAQVRTADAERLISADALRRHVEFLASPALEGRGTPRGKALAAEHIRRRFAELGLQPLFGEEGYFQPIPGKAGPLGERTIIGRNIGAVLPGSNPELRDEYVIVSAHYDHLGLRDGAIYPGADDNAGSVAMMLEVAAALAAAPTAPQRSVVFLSCDLEEQLLWGARWFAAHPPWPLSRVQLFITAEMIGRTLGDLPLGMVFVLGGEHADGLRRIVDQASPLSELRPAHLGIDLIGVRSDYGPFWSEKVPFLFFSGGEHPDYHQPADTADKLDYVRVAQVSRLILHVARQVADVPEPPAWTDAPTHDLDEVRTLHRITELVLSADDAARARGRPRLSGLQRFTVSNVKTRTAQILERGELHPDERPFLITSSQILLLTVF